MARDPVTEDDVEVWGLASPGEQAAHAEHLEELAADPHPNDEVTPAELLVSAGESWSLAGDPARAVACYRAAVAAGGEVAPDVRAYLFDGLLKAAEHAEAGELLAAIKSERPTDPNVYLFVGESLESVDDLAGATRWFTAGLLRAERNDAVPASQLDSLIVARARVRDAQGLPLDEYDEIAVDLVSDPHDDNW